MTAILGFLLTFICVCSALLDGIPSQQVVHQDENQQFIMSEIMRLSQELKESQAKIIALENNVDKLMYKDKDVAFFAYLGKDMVNPVSGTTVLFDEVMTNSRRDYDPTHGVFRAPINGTYYFHFVGASPSNGDASHQLHVYITKNNPTSHVAYGWLDHTTDHWVQTSASTVLHLAEGDRIWVVIGYVLGSHTLAGHQGGNAHTYFSGFLIHAD